MQAEEKCPFLHAFICTFLGSQGSVQPSSSILYDVGCLCPESLLKVQTMISGPVGGLIEHSRHSG